MTTIAASVEHYESWMREQLAGDIVKADLARKHDKMRESSFAFLRATYFRWAETVLEACPDLGQTTSLIAVGDVHLENFGTWRDEDGRLVWGLNDFDEAAEMPFTLDLVRLVTSALVGEALDGSAAPTIAAAVLKGYGQGLEAPGAIVLDRDWPDLRKQMVVSDSDRAKFWDKLLKVKVAKAPESFLAALKKAMPDPAIALQTAPRTAGMGSLGRPRWVGRAEWRGGPVVREAKAVLPSAWYLANAPRRRTNHMAALAGGTYRAPDPWYSANAQVVVRRISPNNRKIEADDPSFGKAERQLLGVMGRELANIHLGDGSMKAAIRRDLGRLPKTWLAKAAVAMAEVIERDYKDYRKS